MLCGDGAKSLCDDIIKFHPEGDTDVCTKLRSNPSYNCQDILLETTHVNLLVVLVESQGDH